MVQSDSAKADKKPWGTQAIQATTCEDSVWSNWEINFSFSTGFIYKWVTLPLNLKVGEQWMSTREEQGHAHTPPPPPRHTHVPFNISASLNGLKLLITPLQWATCGQVAILSISATAWLKKDIIFTPCQEHPFLLSTQEVFMNPWIPVYLKSLSKEGSLFVQVFIISHHCFQVLGSSWSVLIPVSPLALNPSLC